MSLLSCSNPPTMAVKRMPRPAYEAVDKCSVEGREKQTVVADLEGTVVRARSSFPYFLLVALEGGSLLRAFILTLLSPLAWLLHNFVSEAAAMKLLIFISFAGLKLSDIEGVARAVLPKFFAEDVHPLSWRLFSSCRAKCIVTAMPRILVEHFAIAHLGADTVLGTEIQLTKTGRATGLVAAHPTGVLTGANKRKAVKAAFDNVSPDVALGDQVTDLPFMSLAKEAYFVPHASHIAPLPMEKLSKPVIFHDGRLINRPTPVAAMLIFLWLPIGILLATIRLLSTRIVPVKYTSILNSLLGIRLIVRGAPPPADGQGYLFVCSHRTLTDPVALSGALCKQVTAVTYSISRFTEVMSPIKTARLSRNRERDAAEIKRLLEAGDLVICPEGTTCREPYLLRFSALFAELTDRIVPVATRCRFRMFHGTTVRGWKSMDVVFCLMNPIPAYEVIFLDPLPPEMSCGAGGKSGFEVADYIQRQIAQALGFQCTSFTRKDKYRILAGSDGSVPTKRREANITS